MDLHDIWPPFPAQVADRSRRTAAGDEFDLARDFAGAGIVAAQQGLVSVFGQESAGLDHDPVCAPVDGAGQMVEEEDAHRVERMRGGVEGEQSEEPIV